MGQDWILKTAVPESISAARRSFQRSDGTWALAFSSAFNSAFAVSPAF